jgi:hypothetical protein
MAAWTTYMMAKMRNTPPDFGTIVRVRLTDCVKLADLAGRSDIAPD